MTAAEGIALLEGARALTAAERADLVELLRELSAPKPPSPPPPRPEPPPGLTRRPLW